MDNLFVNCASKDDDGVITHIGWVDRNGEGIISPWCLSVLEVIDEIKNRRKKFAIDPNLCGSESFKGLVKIDVVPRGNGCKEYIRTVSDNNIFNNLDELPVCSGCKQ